MGTFITDRLQHLNYDLVQLFQLDAQPPREDHLHGNSPAVSRAKTTITISTSNTNQQGQQEGTVSEQSNLELLTGLRASIGALDLHSGTVPSMEKVCVEIEKVESLLKPALESRQSEEVSRLEHLFIAKCTIAVYLNLLDIILNATLPLANEIQYWQSLLDSRSWRLLYTVQTSPYRLYSTTRSVIISTRQHLESLIGTAAQGSDYQVNTLQLLKFFPTFLSRHLISRPVSFPVAIRYEITHHRKQLQRIREYQAECLGLLAEQGLDLNSEYIEDSISSPSPLSTPNIERLSNQAEQFIQEQVSKTICLMERVLDKASKDTHHVTDPQQQKVPSRNASRSLTVLGNLHGVSIMGNDQSMEHLKKLILVEIPRYVSQTETQAKQFHRPSWLTRIWIPTLIGYFGLKYGIQYISEHRADLDLMLEEAWDTARRFVTDWVWEPSVRIMEIIRHSDNQGSLQMLRNESLKSDIASLERMVLDFGKEQYHLTSDDLASLSSAVHNGDISLIMRAYERELKTPLKGAVVGHLIQTLLIQIQKTKVDVEVAMAALDKLLKANELNFAFLAVGPSLLLLWATTSQVKSVWQRVSGRNMGLVSIQMRNSLRQVERLLNLASADGDGLAHTKQGSSLAKATSPSLAARASDSQDSEEYDDLSNSTTLGTSAVEPLSNSLLQTSEKLIRMRAKKGKVPYKTQGLILCEVHLLRTFAARLTRSEGLRDKVMEDLREIEESSLTIHQRLRTTKRMYRTYGFLGLHQF
ncbi:Nuclear control of ATPase protein 2 [Entomortierella chlamydospora]|nr:Nuclear control of ATPase protein 2 [Entomortierella chlamydospora]